MDSFEMEGVDIGRAVRPRGTTLLAEPCSAFEPSREDIAVDKTPVAARIPWGAVWAVAADFSDCVRRVVHEGTWESLHELGLFAKVGLAGSGRAGKGHWETFAERVAERAEQFHRLD